jgi:hypothetical protein
VIAGVIESPEPGSIRAIPMAHTLRIAPDHSRGRDCPRDRISILRVYPQAKATMSNQIRHSFVAVTLATAAITAAPADAAPGKSGFEIGATELQPVKTQPAPSNTPSLTDIKKLIVDGTPGDWKFVTTATGTIRSGQRIKVGSDYSGHCLTYKSQDRGINLGSVSDCSKTKGGDNIAFERVLGDTNGGELHYGDVVAFSIARDGDRAYVCYGERDHGINLNWGKTDAECKGRSGSKGNGAVQWKLMPVAGSSKKVGDAIALSDRFALHSVVIDKPVVKCARIYAAGVTPTWWAADLKWRSDCMRHELVWTHRELLQSLGEDPKALALSVVPSEYRAVLEKLL